ncbi:MAG: hypothetical protein AB1458_14785, partial [Bacteroidota bacterium]
TGPIINSIVNPELRTGNSFGNKFLCPDCQNPQLALCPYWERYGCDGGGNGDNRHLPHFISCGVELRIRLYGKKSGGIHADQAGP